MATERDRILGTVESYYTEKILEHGPTARGVDWNSSETQHLRFRKLTEGLRADGCSIADIGCGYGALLDFLRMGGASFSYLGIDVSAEMVREAHRLHGSVAGARFAVGDRPPLAVDWVIASGIFNVREGIPDHEWFAYVCTQIDLMWSLAHQGIAFNCLTSRSDPEFRRDYLYYADPSRILAHCLGRSRHVRLLHDYGLYEFTILVRREPFNES